MSENDDRNSGHGTDRIREDLIQKSTSNSAARDRLDNWAPESKPSATPPSGGAQPATDSAAPSGTAKSSD